MSCNCEGKNYNISFGCCEPVLGPVENYYTKYQIDKMIASAVTSGCCITPEEVDEKIEEAISGITVSGVTEEELNNAIASAKTEIEAEIPTVPTSNTAFTNDAGYLTEHQSLSGYATEQWVLDKHYISGVDLSDYALKSEIPTVPTKVSAFENDVPYLTEHQSLSGYVTDVEMSAYTYDKQTIDDKISQGGTFDPSQYYNTAQTNNLIESAVTRVEAEIPTVPTSNTAFTNDAGYLTEHQSLSGYATEQWVLDKNYITGVDLSNYSTTDEVNSAITQATSGKANSSDVYLKSETSGATEIQTALSGKQNTLSAGTGISISGNVISATGGGGGDSCTVNEKVIVKTYDSILYSNLDSVYVCYSGQTYGQYYYLLIDGISSWFNGNINFSTGGHTGRTSGWEDYYTVAWDSANTRFLFTTKGNYKISHIDNTDLYFQVPLYTISGTPCDAAETLADALGDTITNIDKELENKADSSTLYNYLLKSKIWCGTQNEYDSIQNKDSETLYLIHE